MKRDATKFVATIYATEKTYRLAEFYAIYILQGSRFFVGCLFIEDEAAVLRAIKSTHKNPKKDTQNRELVKAKELEVNDKWWQARKQHVLNLKVQRADI